MIIDVHRQSCMNLQEHCGILGIKQDDWTDGPLISPVNMKLQPAAT